MIATPRFVIVYLLLIGAMLFINLHSDLPVTVKRPLSGFPVQVASWRMASQSEFSAAVLGVLKPTDYLYRQYKSGDGRMVTLYIGYHGGGKESGGIHSPKHCLPGSGWFELSTIKRTMNQAGARINMVQSLYQKGESKELFLYWFQVRDKTMNDEYSLKMSEITGSMLYRRRDSSFIRVSVPFEHNEQLALELGERFIHDFFPVIQEFLPK